jgi:hypothetical protein
VDCEQRHSPRLEIPGDGCETGSPSKPLVGQSQVSSYVSNLVLPRLSNYLLTHLMSSVSPAVRTTPVIQAAVIAQRFVLDRQLSLFEDLQSQIAREAQAPALLRQATGTIDFPDMLIKRAHAYDIQKSPTSVKGNIMCMYCENKSRSCIFNSLFFL